MKVSLAYPGAMGARKRLVVALLVAAALAAAVLVLNPWSLQDSLIGQGARALGTVTDHLLPPSLDLHAAEMAGNIALFVPLGFLGALLVPRRRWWTVVLVLVAVSVGIETVQALGLPYRTASVRDVLNNSLGASIGVALAVLLTRRTAVAWD